MYKSNTEEFDLYILVVIQRNSYVRFDVYKHFFFSKYTSILFPKDQDYNNKIYILKVFYQSLEVLWVKKWL